MSDLVIVESPSKAKTIQKYLGKNYDVIASNGHIRDLPKSKLGVDIEHDFKPVYTDMKGKEKVIKELKSHAKKSDKIYLATDPDREGEAISWHLAHVLNLDLNANDRVEFNEITKSGIQKGMSNPRKINLDLVNAQQARRILDRIVGYQLSPFLWKKVKTGLSAGRVQSVVVRLICDREEEIKVFVPEEYWTIDAKFSAIGSDKTFDSRLALVDGKKFEPKSKEETDEILIPLQDKATEFHVAKLKKRVSQKKPNPPFTTSTMQQEASRRLGFTSKRTMAIAQMLYEGVEIQGMGAVGLITYMRTDSLRVSQEAQAAAAEYIAENFGGDFVPEKPNVYKSSKNAQDAHEAIRPSMPDLEPDKIKDDLTNEQYKLYKLIWSRFIASQMANAKLHTTSMDINATNPNKPDMPLSTFKASGYTVVFEGFMAVYKDNSTDDKSRELPPLNEGDKLNCKSLEGNQHFTQPPPRYNEASLIKMLEEKGIGRPSTYAPTISTILSRMYVEKDGKQLKPTVLGEAVTGLMEECFPKIVDASFTAHMESDLDAVERGEKNWVQSLEDFYGDFHETLEEAEKKMEGKRVRLPHEKTDIICEKCGKPMVIKFGKYGKFLACSGFPECKNTKKIVQEAEGTCPLCGKKMIAQKSKRGRSFFGCAGYPDCKFMTWNTPVAEKCPKCGSTLFRKGGMKTGILVCEKPGCGYTGPLNGRNNG